MLNVRCSPSGLHFSRLVSLRLCIFASLRYKRAMENERKTLDDRAKMTELERIRHSCAHVMATAILRLWPDAQFASGPPVENGFYYDVELPHRISPEDFPKIEAEMKKEIKANHVFRENHRHARAGDERCPERTAGRARRAAGQPEQIQARQPRKTFPKASRSPISRAAISSTSAPGRT